METTSAKTAKPHPKSAALHGSQHLHYVLSPLEEAALSHAFKPFVYGVYGESLYVPAWACQELRDSALAKVRLLETLASQNKLCAAIPIKDREALFDPRVILSLPPRLRNRLCRLECYSLFAVMQKGRAFFETEQKFTAKAMSILESTFETYGAKALFR